MSQLQPKTVYFVRHGQSVDNALPVFQSVKSPLSDKGCLQAEAIAVRLADMPFDALISSPIARASQTATYISNTTHRQIEFSKLFVERIKPSDIDGKPWSDAAATKTWRQWEDSLYKPGLKVTDGENYDETVARVDKALAYLAARPEDTIVVVTHAYILRAIIARVLLGDGLTGDSMWRMQHLSSIQNTSLTTLRYADAYEEDVTWRLLTLNDNSHFLE